MTAELLKTLCESYDILHKCWRQTAPVDPQYYALTAAMREIANKLETARIDIPYTQFSSEAE